MNILTLHITVELPDNVQLPDEKIKVNVNPPARVAPARKKTTKSYKRWTKEEIKFLIENYGSMTYDEIAEALGKDKKQVENKAYFLRKRNTGKGRPTKTAKKKTTTRRKTATKKKSTYRVVSKGRKTTITRRPPKHLGKISDNGNGLTCADCPKAEKESGGTVYCTIYGVRKKADTPMCQEMADLLNEVRP